MESFTALFYLHQRGELGMNFFLQKCVTALDLTWHPDHFFCAQCGRPFGDDGFHEKNGKAYCR